MTSNLSECGYRSDIHVLTRFTLHPSHYSLHKIHRRPLTSPKFNMASTTTPPSEALASLSIAKRTPVAGTSASAPRPPPTPAGGQPRKEKKEKKLKPKADPNVPGGGKKPAPKPTPSSSTKLRGMDRDPPEVRLSKTISWLLRHGAQSEGLAMRADGYVKVVDLVRACFVHRTTWSGCL